MSILLPTPHSSHLSCTTAFASFFSLQELINRAIEASVAARQEWDLKPIQDRAQVLLKAADLLSGPRRAEVLAKTMIGQVSTGRGAGGGASCGWA